MRQGGFTLLELMVVIVITALLSVGAVLALPSAGERALHQEAERLAIWLELARAQSRSRGVPVWVRMEDGLVRVDGVQSGALPAFTWKSSAIHAQPVRLALGPEPVIAAQRVVLRGDGAATVRVATNGVQPFALQTP